jgi:hypothetical protein
MSDATSGHSSTVLMGNPGIGKSVFGLYFAARLITSETSIFGHSFILISWCPDNRGARRWIRVTFRGEVTRITKATFDDDAESGAFAILDGMTYHKKAPIDNYLSIISPSECVWFPAAKVRRYAPPIEPEQLTALLGVSKEYPLNDDGTERETHGSIASRMKIVGGNLRLLFSTESLKELKDYFIGATRKIAFTRVPTSYFQKPQSGMEEPYHCLFACFPKAPFDHPGDIGYVSDYVLELVQEAFTRLSDKGVYDEIRRMNGMVNALLGLGLRAPSVRGKLFEDVCHEAMQRVEGDKLHLYIVPNTDNTDSQGAQTVQIPYIGNLDWGDLKSMPASAAFPWLCAVTDRNNPGFHGLFCDGRSIYVVQMTTSDKHDPVSLRGLQPFVMNLVTKGLPVSFVVLTDTWEHLDAIICKKSSMLRRDIDWHPDIPEYVGVLTDPYSKDTVRLNFPRRRPYYPRDCFETQSNSQPKPRIPS